MRVQKLRDLPQTKLDSVINARFLLKEHGDPTFYFINSMRTISSKTEELTITMATFLANEINATNRDITDPTEQAQITFPLKDNNIN